MHELGPVSMSEVGATLEYLPEGSKIPSMENNRHTHDELQTIAGTLIELPDDELLGKSVWRNPFISAQSGRANIIDTNGKASGRQNPAQSSILLQLVAEVIAMSWQDRITIDSNMLVGKPVIMGTRISVEFIIDLLARGWTTAQVLREYDHLKPEDIQACLAYARDVLKSEKVYLLPTL
jgi:uncharacterized protein (DUF433 family)